MVHMVHIAFCEDCNVMHDVTYRDRLDAAFLSLVAWHSERHHGHVVIGREVKELDVSFLTPADYLILSSLFPGYMIGQIEDSEIDIT